MKGTTHGHLRLSVFYRFNVARGESNKIGGRLRYNSRYVLRHLKYDFQVSPAFFEEVGSFGTRLGIEYSRDMSQDMKSKKPESTYAGLGGGKGKPWTL